MSIRVDTFAIQPGSTLPAGLRVYAIGDIHGRFDLLQNIVAAIRQDIDRKPPERSVEIFLGDYVDRGPCSKEVLDWLTSVRPLADERICLTGNHEAMLLDALDDPNALPNWLYNGGGATLASYGVDADARSWTAVWRALNDVVPNGHREFLKNLRRTEQFGGYRFVHAGFRPGRAIEHQDEADLIWIREPFLHSRADFGCIVVHGHTPVEFPDVRSNRINIDTGAFFTGCLTCLILDGDKGRILQTRES
jgi:serine/threonine protein phosphatase 1